MSQDKKSPCEVEARRVTDEDIEKIWSAALDSQNQQMLAWVYLMQEVLYIRKLLEQQKQPRDGCNCGGNSTYDGENK